MSSGDFNVYNTQECCIKEVPLPPTLSPVVIYPEYIIRKYFADIPTTNCLYDNNSRTLTIDLPVDILNCKTVDKYNNYKVLVKKPHHQNPHEVGGPNNNTININAFIHAFHNDDLYFYKDHIKQRTPLLQLVITENYIPDNTLSQISKNTHIYWISDMQYINNQLICNVKLKHAHHNSIASYSNNTEFNKHFNIDFTHADIKTCQIHYNFNEGSPTFMSGCWWAYSVQWALILTAITTTEIVLAVASGGVEAGIVIADEFVYTLLSYFITQAMEGLQTVIVSKIIGIIDNDDDSNDNATESMNQLTEVAIANGTVGTTQTESASTYTTVIFGAVNLIVSILQQCGLTITTSQMNDIQIGTGIAQLVIAILLGCLSPTGNLPPLAAMILTLLETSCWMRDWNENFDMNVVLHHMLENDWNIPVTCGTNCNDIYNAQNA